MHLEQSIHDATSLTVSIVRGETSTWTVYKVEVDGVMLEFTAFGELPLAVEVFDDTAIPDLVDFLSDQGAIIDKAKAGRRAAEKVCETLRRDLEQVREDYAESVDAHMFTTGQLAESNAELLAARIGDVDGSIA